MKFRSAPGLLAYAVSVVFIYHFGVSPFCLFANDLYFRHVLCPLVKSKDALIGDNRRMLGLYRPELPFSFSGLRHFEDGTSADVSIVSFYQAWGDANGNEFKSDVMRKLSDNNLIPMITWEPWISAFHKYLGNVSDSSTAKIASGEFDYYIRRFALDAVEYGKPFFIRPFHEPSNPEYLWGSCYKNSPEMYKKAWRHVVEIFRETGTVNAAFVWSPRGICDTAYYPGTEYVDWIGLDIFNFGTIYGQKQWLSFSEIVSPYKSFLGRTGKPLMISEVGCVPVGGDRPLWYADMFRALGSEDNMFRAVVLFDNPAARVPGGYHIDLGFSTDTSAGSRLSTQVFTGSGFRIVGEE